MTGSTVKLLMSKQTIFMRQIGIYGEKASIEMEDLKFKVILTLV